jgi:hypothetical protein
MNAPYRIDVATRPGTTVARCTQPRSLWEWGYGGVNGARRFAEIRRQPDEISGKSPRHTLAWNISKFN